MEGRIAILFLAGLFLYVSSNDRVFGQPLVNVETVLVGDAGNAAHIRSDGSVYGAVGYNYRIGKYETTIAQYCAFLNAVARTNTNSYVINLWNPNMAADLKTAGISRSGDGSAVNPYSYSVIGPSGITPAGASSPGNRPITYVNWFDAARFANWMHNGATNNADTESGAYVLNGATNGTLPQHDPDSVWWVPTVNEWYKAAFYKGGANAGYWAFAFQAAVPGSNSIGSAPYQANTLSGLSYDEWGYTARIAVTGATYGAGQAFGFYYEYGISNNQNYLTDVGAFTGSSSAYGTYDQEGNVGEWAFTGNAVGPWYSGPPNKMGGSWFETQGGNISWRFPDVEENQIGFRLAKAAVIPTKLISVEQPFGVALVSGSGTNSLGPTLVGSTSAPTVWTIRNTGTASLKNISVTKEGSHAADFSIVSPDTNTLASAAITAFSVSFAPTGGGNRSALIRINSDATNNNSFTVNLSGIGISETNDGDADGLNDAAEFSMSSLGFNWQLAQPSLVATLYSNANRARLFTQPQLDASRVAGRSDVTTNPAIYNLYTTNSIMDLRMGGLMIQRQGSNAVVTFQPQTTTDLANQSFTNSGAAITNVIPMPVSKGFLRIQAR